LTEYIEAAAKQAETALDPAVARCMWAAVAPLTAV
jgi:hypothetical protein